MAKLKGITGLVTDPIATAYHKIPSVSTANLPGAGVNAAIPAVDGMLVYNTTLGMLQQRAGGVWSGITTAPVITSFQYSDGAAATAEKTVVGLVSISCTTQTSTTVLVPGASLGIEVGMVVAGTGIPVGATVVSVIEDTSFVISAAATASATVTLTFGGAVTITGSNFDSILAGGSSNIAVTFDGTTATSISVNSLKTIITCTPPAHAAGTITLLLTNASGLTASTNFIYDIEPVFTTAAGSIGGFVEAITYAADADAPRIQGTENSVALTSGFARVTSATDSTVITTAINGLTLQGTGYLTGTLTAASNATTFPFYAVATDDEGQKTAPRLFNIISYDYAATGGTESTISGYRVHTFTTTGSAQTFTSNVAMTVEVLVIAGGGGGGRAGGGGAGGLIQIMTGIGNVNTIGLLPVTASNYTINIGIGGIGDTRDSVGDKTNGGDTTMSGAGITTLTAKGGGYGGWSPVAGTVGGSGGGGGFNATTTAPASNQATGFGSYTGIGFGNAGGAGAGSSGSNAGGGGGGSGGAGGAGSQSNPPDGGTGKQININGTNTWYAGGGTSAGHSGSVVYSQAQTQGSGYSTDDANPSTLVLATTYGSGGGANHSTYTTLAAQAGKQGIVIIRYAV